MGKEDDVVPPKLAAERITLPRMGQWFEVIESKHEIQNPTSHDKITLLGDRLGLAPSAQLLDIASGQGGPALILARAFGCQVTCAERSAPFLSAATRRIQEAGVDQLVELVHSDGQDFAIEPDSYDAAMCLGASFIWGGIEQTATALSHGVRAGGHVAVGEVFWRRWPLPEGFEPGEDFDFATLEETAARFEKSGVELVTLIASSQDDWDRYESLHWHALAEWLEENPNDADAERFRELGRQERDMYLRWHRDLLGWAIFVGRP